MSAPVAPASASTPFPRWVFLLGLLTAIAPLSIDMYLPAFPAIEQELGVSNGAVQLSLASFFIGLALGQLIYGPISDRFGRKPPLYVGLALFALSSLACALAPSVELLIGLRFLQGLGGSAGPVIARAVVRDRCDAGAAARALSTLVLVMGVAPITAPLLGGWMMALSSWRAIFIALMVFGLALLGAVHYRMSESHRPVAPPPLRLGSVLRTYGSLLADRSFMAFVVAGGLIQAGLFAYIAGSPFVFIELYGLSPSAFGWVFAFNAGGLVIASQLNARLLVHITPTASLRWSIWLPLMVSGAAMVSALLGWMPLALLVGALFLYLSFFSFVVPNTTALALDPQGARAGAASALMGGLQFATGTLAALAMGLWHDGTALPMLGIMTFCAGGSCLVWLLAARRLAAAAS